MIRDLCFDSCYPHVSLHLIITAIILCRYNMYALTCGLFSVNCIKHLLLDQYLLRQIRIYTIGLKKFYWQEFFIKSTSIYLCYLIFNYIFNETFRRHIINFVITIINATVHERVLFIHTFNLVTRIQIPCLHNNKYSIPRFNKM